MAVGFHVEKNGAALGLPKVRADRLLRAAGLPTIDRLEAGATHPVEQELLARWTSAAPHNLPAPVTSFVGREDEILEIADLLCAAPVRLVTLTGPGGSGKTRLGLQVARALLDTFPDGVFFVALAAIVDPALVTPTIARTLGVNDVAGAPPIERLAAYLRERRLLLLLDNFEQVVPAGPEVVALLTAAPHLKVLVTSRVALHVSGEHERPVPPLTPPAGDATVAEAAGNPAVALFVERARAVNPRVVLTVETAPAVVELCRRLDGLPLAIELAAARCRQFTPDELLARFPSRLELSGDGPLDAPARQRALRATIDWSYHLLGPDVRRRLARLAVFAGGWTAESATAICTTVDGRSLDVAGGLAVLRDFNLIERGAGAAAAARYRMLETIREYALDRLAAGGEADALRRQHAAVFLDLAESAEPYVPGTQQGAWLDRIEQEHDNLRAALGWALEQDAETALRLTGALWPFWHEYGYLREGSRSLGAALARSDGLAPALRAQALTGAFLLAFSQGDFAQARVHGEASLALWQALHDHHGLALVLLYQGLAHYNAGDFAQAEAHYTRSLEHWRALAEPRGIARCLSELALMLCTTRRHREAEAPFAEALALYEQTQDEAGIARSFTDRGLSALLAGDIATAIPLLQQGVALSRSLRNNQNLPAVLAYLGFALLLAGAHEPALDHLSEALRLRQEAGDKLGISYCLSGLAAVASRTGQAERAVRLCGAVAALQESIGVAMVPGVRAIYDQALPALRAQLGDTAFETAFAQGRAMPLTEAIADALAQA